jgi:hypothetical protein
VVLTFGPEEEVGQVRQIYSMFTRDGLTEQEIAARLNEAGIYSDLGRPWTRSSIHQILTNEKYIGNNVFNRVSFKLKQKRVINDPATWVRADGVYVPERDYSYIEINRSIRQTYRYYVSRPCLHGEAKTAKVGSITRAPAADIEEVIVKSLNEHLKSQGETPGTMSQGAIARLIDRIEVHKDRLVVQLRSQQTQATTKTADDSEEPTGDCLLSIPWQKPPFKRFREILLPHGSSRREVRPEKLERRLRLVSAMARGRRWLDEIISGSVTSVEEIASRERCSVRHVNMTISLAFLAPKLVRAAVEGRLPRGINIERLRDSPAEWSRQFEALGLNPHAQ